MAGDLRSRPLAQGGRCERARQWASQRLDGELSELECALLEKHLETCSECLAFDGELRSTAEMLRAAPMEATAVRFQIPAARIRFPLSRRLAVAGVAVAAVLGSLVGSNLNRPAPRPQQPAPQVSFLTRDLSELRQLPRQQHLKPVAPEREPGGPPEGVI